VTDGKLIRFKYLHHVLVFYHIYKFTLDFIEKQSGAFRVADIFGMIQDDMRLDLAERLIEIGYLKKVKDI
jgi:hypothetical protein